METQGYTKSNRVRRRGKGPQNKRRILNKKGGKINKIEMVTWVTLETELYTNNCHFTAMTLKFARHINTSNIQVTHTI